MKYTQKTFSAPAGPPGISQRQWDRAVLTPEQYAAKYGSAEFSYVYRNGCPILADK